MAIIFDNKIKELLSSYPFIHLENNNLSPTLYLDTISYAQQNDIDLIVLGPKRLKSCINETEEIEYYDLKQYIRLLFPCFSKKDTQNCIQSKVYYFHSEEIINENKIPSTTYISLIFNWKIISLYNLSIYEDFNIIYKSDSYSIIDKPCGEIISPYIKFENLPSYTSLHQDFLSFYNLINKEMEEPSIKNDTPYNNCYTNHLTYPHLTYFDLVLRDKLSKTSHPIIPISTNMSGLVLLVNNSKELIHQYEQLINQNLRFFASLIVVYDNTNEEENQKNNNETILETNENSNDNKVNIKENKLFNWENKNNFNHLISTENINQLSDISHQYNCLKHFQLISSLQISINPPVNSRVCKYLSLAKLSIEFNNSTNLILKNFINNYYNNVNTNILNDEIYPKDYFKIFEILSQDIKKIMYYLKSINLNVAGYDKILKSAKSLMFQWNNIIIDDNNNINNYSINLSSKILTLLLNEEKFYIKYINNKIKNYNLNNYTSNIDSLLPIEYQINKSFFYNYEFFVNNNVMIPRKSSETLINSSKELLIKNYLTNFTNTDDNMNLNNSNTEDINIIDLGTGSGCLLLSLLLNLAENYPQKYVGIGIDLSELALEVANKNSLNLIKNNNKMNEIISTNFIRGSFTSIDIWKKTFEEIEIKSNNSFISLILCNPPYSSNKNSKRLGKVVTDYEPSLALFAHTTDELFLYRELAKTIYELISNQIYQKYFKTNKNYTYFVIEVGSGQNFSVIKLFNEFCPVLIHIDNNIDHLGIIRSLVFQYNGK